MQFKHEVIGKKTFHRNVTETLNEVEFRINHVRINRALPVNKLKITQLALATIAQTGGHQISRPIVTGIN